MEKLKQAQGNVVTGDRFWDREEDIALLIKRIDEGAHVLLVAQRRMGKTSLMAEVYQRLSERYVCLFIDLQKAASGSDAIVELSLAVQPHKPLWNKTKEVFANVIEAITEKVEKVGVGELGLTLRAGLTAGNWAAKGDQLFEILAESEKPVLLLLDEVPILINRMLKGEAFTVTAERRKETDEFMSWLRKNSIRHQGKLRIMISGSIGLEPILHQARLSAGINNFVPFELKAWDADTAVKCLEALANEYGIKYEEGVATNMAERLECCIPHHVQMFFSHVHDRCVRKNSMTCSAEDVAQVYESDMLGVRGHVELTHYEERLEQVLGPEIMPIALEMLTEAAVVGCLSQEAIGALQKYYKFTERSTGDIQKEILWVLEHDGYLKQEDLGYVFVSKLLQDWWKSRYRNHYTPILQREE
ncbi:MAG TPA: ATP-binding protein [Planctomycetes bacterium]|nr:ATP-binding protein [Planctomycetota bacterium]